MAIGISPKCSTFGIIRGLMFFEHQVPMIFSRCWKFERSRHPTTYSEQHFVLFGVFLESFSFVRINENGKKIFSSVDARIKHRRQTRHLCRSLKFFIKKKQCQGNDGWWATRCDIDDGNETKDFSMPFQGDVLHFFLLYDARANYDTEEEKKRNILESI